VSGDHGHAHGPAAARAGARFAPRLRISFALIATFFVVEAVAGFLTGSLALLSDAGHMLTDVVGLGMALAAIHLASRLGATDRRSFGLYRLEILAALLNAGLLFGIAGYVLLEAALRFGDAPEVHGGAVMVVAAAGLAANLVVFLLLRQGSKESLNVEGAYLEVLADTVGSVGVLIGGAVVTTTGWAWVDPLVGAAIGLWILPRTWRLARQALRILLQAAPPDVNLESLRSDLAALPDVVDVHDLHLWTLTSDMEVASAHVMVRAGTDSHAVLDQARALLAERYRISHATLQVEPDDHTGCDDVAW
jgi:cobalt-zinc-cadmium efflux system protein